MKCKCAAEDTQITGIALYWFDQFGALEIITLLYSVQAS